MADEEQPEGAELSKRERQKQRRREKRAQELAQQRRARRTRRAVLAVVVVLALGGAGYGGAQLVGSWQEDRALRAEAAEQLDELGCEEQTQMPDLGAQHITPEAVAQFPPEEIYDHRPATSGLHFGQVVVSGVYDKLVDERLLVHNLEHGYIVAYYGEDADPDEVAELREAAEEQMGGNFPKTIVAPWDGALPDGAQFAYSAWRNRQLCEQFHPGVLLTFLREFHGTAGSAPEAEVPAHMRPAGQGELDPAEVDGPLLLPPLGEGSGADDGDFEEHAGE